MSRRVPPLLLPVLADLAVVVLFAAIGRSAHEHGDSVAGVLSTAWPFLVGTAVGWLVAARTVTGAWLAALRLWPTGAIVWACTWALGMVLRGVTGGGLAPSFLLVAALVLAAMLAAWRGLARLVLHPGTLTQD